MTNAGPFCWSATVHPRWCGEHPVPWRVPEAAAGSSPLVRGTFTGDPTSGGTERFIPAGAGNIAIAWNALARVAVHPRWCGEHMQSIIMLLFGAGSSPLVRGTYTARAVRPRWCRFIPAGAGNITTSPPPRWTQTVHPRWCGEHSNRAMIFAVSIGSSPLVRGTFGCCCKPGLCLRFIPAGAGNISARLRAALTSPVHPRWCGEHPLQAVGRP